MIIEVSTVAFHQNLEEMLDLVQDRIASIVINNDGRPVAALIDTALFAGICRLKDRFNSLCARISTAYAEVPDEEGMAEIDAAVQAEQTLD